MTGDGRRKVDLDVDDAAYVDSKVASGEYPTAAAVVSEGLTELRRQEVEFETWVRTEVLPVCDAMDADPSRSIPIDEVFARLRARHAARFNRQG